jgi:DNA-binding transcriptional MerR regulator
MTVSGGSAAASQPWHGSDDARPDESQLMSIGEVLAHLRAEFADTTISKLRFLEAEGLVDPHRTPAGYRKYTWADVARLRYVLTAQRDHYLPLRVIRDQLAAIDRGEAPAMPRPALVSVPRPAVTDAGAEAGAAGAVRALAGAGAGSAGDTIALAVHPGADARLTRTELLARAGVDEGTLRDLEQHGLVAAGPGGWYPVDAVEVVAVAGALAEFGLQARHLRAYRAAADREVGLFTQLAAPLARGSGPAARDRAAETIRELSTLTQRLQAALVRVGLSETLGW